MPLSLGLYDVAVLFFLALVAGAINAVSGGGSFISFPALIAIGVPAVPANATNTVAMLPGSFASLGAYRRQFAKRDLPTLIPLAITGLLGAVIGAVTLLKTPQHTFLRLIPFLLATATLVFMFSGPITRWIRERKAKVGERSWKTWSWTLTVELCIAVYVGYFGAGSGIPTLALLALLGMTNINTMNAYKTTLVTVGNTIAAVIFIVAGKVFWMPGGVMLVGGITGGYVGAYVAQKMNPQHVRYVVIVIGWSMSLYFFRKYGF